MPGNDESRWEKRIARAKLLAGEVPSAAEVLTFYAEICTFQQSLFIQLKRTLGEVKPGKAAPQFRECFDAKPLLVHVPALLSLIRRAGTPLLAQAAEELARSEAADWESLLTTYWRAEAHTLEGAPLSHVFFAHVLVQPCAELAASRMGMEFPRVGPPSCPVCCGRPQVGVLREDGHGARRSLLCSFCFTEWGYRRTVCPACGEERVDSLPVYTASQFEHVRVEACDTCKTYIKTVDLTNTGLAVPEVDDLATVTLSLWAEEKGYKKLHPNLLGI